MLSDVYVPLVAALLVVILLVVALDPRGPGRP